MLTNQILTSQLVDPDHLVDRVWLITNQVDRPWADQLDLSLLIVTYSSHIVLVYAKKGLRAFIIIYCDPPVTMNGPG